MAETAEALTERMGEVDPKGAERYRDNLTDLTDGASGRR